MLNPMTRRFRNLTPYGAWLLLSVLVILIVYGIHVRQRTQSLVTPNTKLEDMDIMLYQRIVDRVHAGQGYYDVTGDELRAGGYPLRPFLTWRTPALATFMARFPSANASRLAITALACAALWLWIGALKDEGSRWLRVIGGILLAAPLLVTALPPCHLQHEAWSGVCIALSLALYARGYWPMSVLVGVLAVFLRELAVPFLAVMLVMAWWDRRKGETLAWLVGLAAFAVFLGIHAWVVSHHVTATDRVSQGWLQLGGWPFVIKTARANLLLLITPSWVAGVVLPLALLGLGGWSSPTGTRAFLTVGAYVTAFLFAGRPIHAYWGLMYAPLLSLGLIFAPRALNDILQAAGLRRGQCGCHTASS